jgi:hypothetical protein
VLSCLRTSHLRHVFASAPDLWVGWNAKVGGFVYVQLFSTVELAAFEARYLRLEETGLADQFVISQHIAPYKGSPVPGIMKCLGGRMISKPPRRQAGRFHF